MDDLCLHHQQEQHQQDRSENTKQLDENSHPGRFHSAADQKEGLIITTSGNKSERKDS